MPIYALGDLEPHIDPSAFVHPDAVVIGRVRIGRDASIWPTAVLRGDFGLIVVGDRTSVQDGTVIHASAEHSTMIGSDCVVGHNAHLEGCVVEQRCLIASMSTVLERVTVGTGSLIGAGAVVAPGTTVPPGSLALGVPARISPVRDFEAQLSRGVRVYVENARRYTDQLRRL